MNDLPLGNAVHTFLKVDETSVYGKCDRVQFLLTSWQASAEPHPALSEPESFDEIVSTNVVNGTQNSSPHF